jgi:competence ComEA-like helix-hairpin-helix protein
VQIAVSEKKQDKPQFEEFTETPTAKKYNKPLTDINTADTAAFIALPGIGSKLASRLVLFREKLGGFYSINQVAETFGLPDSTYQLIKPLLTINNKYPIKQININTATIDHLKAHPYIKYPLANAIVQYRSQHGQFTQLEQLKNIVLMTPEMYDKIAVYLSL